MVHSRILDVDHDTGRQTIHHYDYATQQTTIEVVQDTQTITDINKELYKGDDLAVLSRGGKEMVRVASVPTLIWYELKKKGIIDDDKAYRRWLNDRDNRGFRTVHGRV